MSLREATQVLLERHGVTPDPSMDEQQLVDEEAIACLVESAGIEAGDAVVEVGPGSGNITERLLLVAGRVIVVEKSPKYVPVLLDRFRGATRLDIILGNALTADIPRHDRLVSNLPYMIGEAMLHRFPRLGFKKASIIVPEGFGERLTAGVGAARYTKLTHFAQLFFSISHVRTIPPAAYMPEPGTSTWIVSLTPRSPRGQGEHAVRELVLQRDKLVKNAIREALIRAGLCGTKREARSKLGRLQIPNRILARSVSRLPLSELLRLEDALGAL